MSTRRALLLIILGVALASPRAVRAELPENRAARAEIGAQVDHQGDPLPPGAIARLGSSRLRHGKRVWSVAFAPDGKTVASGSHDKTVRLWNAATGEEIRRFVGHTSDVNVVAFASDGKTLVTGGGRSMYPPYKSDLTIRFWDRATGKEIRSFTEPRALQVCVFVYPQCSNQPLASVRAT